MTLRNTLLFGCLALFIAGAAEARIERVSKRLGFFELYGGYASPLGKINGFPIENGDFIVDGDLIESDASDTYGSTGSFGFAFGGMRAGHTQAAIGFRYTKFAYTDDPEWSLDPETDFSAYDLTFDLNYRFLDFQTSPFSPYVGVGMFAGIVRAHTPGVPSEHLGTIGLKANFGAELKVWENDEGNAISLISMNDYQFVSTNDRPRYLNIGGAFRYYFAP